MPHAAVYLGRVFQCDVQIHRMRGSVEGATFPAFSGTIWLRFLQLYFEGWGRGQIVVRYDVNLSWPVEINGTIAVRPISSSQHSQPLNTWLGEDCDFYQGSFKDKTEQGLRWKKVEDTNIDAGQTKGSEKVKAPTSQ